MRDFLVWIHYQDGKVEKMVIHGGSKAGARKTVCAAHTGASKIVVVAAASADDIASFGA